jgi:predicted esterase YcpF (UPF0227 family)
VTFRALRDSGNVIRVVLIADDPDDFAAIVLKALAQNLDQKVRDIIPAAWLGKELGGYKGAHLAHSFRIRLVLVARPRTPPLPANGLVALKLVK